VAARIRRAQPAPEILGSYGIETCGTGTSDSASDYAEKIIIPPLCHPFRVSQKELAETRRHRLTFIFLPYNTKAYESEINDLKSLIEKNNLPCLDLRQALKPPIERFFLEGDCCHFSIQGNKAMADLLYKHRAKLGL
jgi:hypothetical protein